MTEQTAIERFHAMWDNFPARARLIHKNRLVLAVNTFAANEGMKAGERCCDRPPAESHRHCLADKALAAQRGMSRTRPDGVMVFWAPVIGCEDVYVHGSIGPKTDGVG